MVERQKISNADEISHLLGPPPQLEGQDSIIYRELIARLHRDLGARDVIEQIWIRDIADNTTDVWRWRRLRTQLLDQAKLEQRDEVSATAESTLNGEFFPIQQKFLRVMGLIERFDHLISMAEARRNSVLREIDRRRALYAVRMREKLHEIEDAHFETIETNVTAVKSAPGAQHVQRTKKEVKSIERKS